MDITKLPFDESQKSDQLTVGEDELIVIDNGGPSEWQDHFCWVVFRQKHLEKFWPKFDYTRIFLLQKVENGVLHILSQQSVKKTEEYARKVFGL